MTISQLSIFIENKSGTLLQVLNLLKEAGISLIASNIADTVEYGICRIICGEPARAYSVLKEAGIAEVFTPGTPTTDVVNFIKEHVKL